MLTMLRRASITCKWAALPRRARAAPAPRHLDNGYVFTNVTKGSFNVTFERVNTSDIKGFGPLCAGMDGRYKYCANYLRAEQRAAS